MSEPGFLSAPIPGGVQVCTAEFVALFQAAGFDTLFYPVTARRDLLTRAAIRLGLDVYGRYDVEAHAAAIARQAVSTGASVIALNQMDIAPLAGRLRAAGTRFVIEPHVRFKGEPGEQATMFFMDPCGNALEFKAFNDLGQLFAK